MSVFEPDLAGIAFITHSPVGPVAEIVNHDGETVRDSAKGFAPVDTGALRDSIHTQPGVDAIGPYCDVVDGVSYGIYQELGTRFQSGTPHLRPALGALASGL